MYAIRSYYAPDFGSLWTNIKGSDPYARDKVSELLLTAQYESTQTYNGRYGSNTSFIHLYNSNHTNFRASVGRTMEYGRPFVITSYSIHYTKLYEKIIRLHSIWFK